MPVLLHALAPFPPAEVSSLRGDFFVSLELYNFLCRKGSIRSPGGVYYPQQVTARHQKEDSMESTEYRDLVRKLMEQCTEQQAKKAYLFLLQLMK